MPQRNSWTQQQTPLEPPSFELHNQVASCDCSNCLLPDLLWAFGALNSHSHGSMEVLTMLWRCSFSLWHLQRFEATTSSFHGICNILDLELLISLMLILLFLLSLLYSGSAGSSSSNSTSSTSSSSRTRSSRTDTDPVSSCYHPLFWHQRSSSHVCLPGCPEKGIKPKGPAFSV